MIVYPLQSTVASFVISKIVPSDDEQCDKSSCPSKTIGTSTTMGRSLHEISSTEEKVVVDVSGIALTNVVVKEEAENSSTKYCTYFHDDDDDG